MTTIIGWAKTLELRDKETTEYPCGLKGEETTRQAANLTPRWWQRKID